MKLYICGMITKDPNYKAKFAKAEAALREAGFETENPCDHGDMSISWGENMRRVVPLMLASDGVALHTDWPESEGARIEVDLARKFEMPVRYTGEWEASHEVSMSPETRRRIVERHGEDVLRRFIAEAGYAKGTSEGLTEYEALCLAHSPTLSEARARVLRSRENPRPKRFSLEKRGARRGAGMSM
jgi:hypothetical protein